jgi:mannose-6-phosphate isomerase-like protein (cupin superfamily)
MTDSRPRKYALLGNLIHFHAFSTETNGRYCVVECRSAPGAGAPPNHHATEDECFYVLEGSFEFMIEGETRRAGVGDFVRIPTGALHAFSAVGDSPGRMLIVNAPGAMHDEIFSRAGEAVPDETIDIPQAEGEPDIPRILAIAAEAGMTIVSPE